MAARLKVRSDDGEDVEGHAVKGKFFDADGAEVEDAEVEGHLIRVKGRSGGSEEDAEGHGPIFRLTVDDPALVTALGRAAGIEGPGEAEITDRKLPLTVTTEDGTEVEGHYAKVRIRDAGDGDLEADVEGHAARLKV
jgi:hypothetical protein